MANVWTFDLESESSQVSYYDIESNCVTSVHVSSKKMIDIIFYFKWYESSERVGYYLEFSHFTEW